MNTPSNPTPPRAELDAAIHASIDRYWRANVAIMAVLLTIWAVVGLGCGVLFADWLNRFAIGGLPLGFWFAQQGSIATFVVIILVYAVLLNRLDAKHREELKKLHALREDGSIVGVDDRDDHDGERDDTQESGGEASA
ncbi:MAG: DUF4212 domain-containing protein [Planctomycetota bacterium]